MTPNYWENVQKILIEKYEISKTDLWNLSIVVNKKTFWKYLKQWEEDGKISIRVIGKEKLVSLSSPEKAIKEFINDFGMRLEIYENELKKNITALEKNLPLINPKKPMIPVKGFRRGVLELDKKNNVWRDMGKTEKDDSLRTWNPRKKPLKHFENILQLLNNLYQQSSVLTFESDIITDFDLMNKYQIRAKKILKDYTKKIQDMFEGTVDFVFAISRMRIVLNALVYRATMEAKMKQ